MAKKKKLFKSPDGRLCEAFSAEEAAEAMGAEAESLLSYRKPSKKEFLLWAWMRLGMKDGALLKHMVNGTQPDFFAEYNENPDCVRLWLGRNGVDPRDWLMMGERGYDRGTHDCFFYRKSKGAETRREREADCRN